jgi:hypothetical protein
VNINIFLFCFVWLFNIFRVRTSRARPEKVRYVANDCQMLWGKRTKLFSNISKNMDQIGSFYSSNNLSFLLSIHPETICFFEQQHGVMFPKVRIFCRLAVLLLCAGRTEPNQSTKVQGGKKCRFRHEFENVDASTKKRFSFGSKCDRLFVPHMTFRIWHLCLI